MWLGMCLSWSHKLLVISVSDFVLMNFLLWWTSHQHRIVSCSTTAEWSIQKFRLILIKNLYRVQSQSEGGFRTWWVFDLIIILALNFSWLSISEFDSYANIFKVLHGSQVTWLSWMMHLNVEYVCLLFLLDCLLVSREPYHAGLVLDILVASSVQNRLRHFLLVAPRLGGDIIFSLHVLKLLGLLLSWVLLHEVVFETNQARGRGGPSSSELGGLRVMLHGNTRSINWWFGDICWLSWRKSCPWSFRIRMMDYIWCISTLRLTN